MAPLFDPPVSNEDEFTIDTARICLTQLVEKNHELKLILDSLMLIILNFEEMLLKGPL